MMAEYVFLTPEDAWDARVDYRHQYYRQNIASYSGDRTELNATSSDGMFWRRTSKCKIHVPIAADIAAISANLLFSEEPTMVVYDEKTEDNASNQQRRLDELIAKNNIHGKLNEAAESCAALGDVYLKLNYSKDDIDYPVMSVVPADAAWPEYLLGVLKGIHFFSVLKHDYQTGIITRVYELYQPGKITMAIYEGDNEILGRELGDEALREYGFEREIIPPVKDMLAVHIPNMRPNRMFRDSYMGRSDYDGLRDLMDSLDEAYSSWMRDIRLGKARTIVPAEYLKRKPQEMLEGLASSASWEFDPDVESYVAIDMTDSNGNVPGITLQQFAIRSNEYAATCAELMMKIVSIAGYAPQSFGMDISGMAQSGTALHIREKKSYDTRGKKQTYWQSPLEQIMTAMVHLDNALFPDAGSDSDDNVKVRFADSAANDVNTMASAVHMLAAANAISLEQRVELLHPDWTKKQTAEEVERLRINEYITLMDKGIISRAEVRAAYMEESEEQAKRALQEIFEYEMQQRMGELEAEARIATQAKAAQEAQTQEEQPEEQPAKTPVKVKKKAADEEKETESINEATPPGVNKWPARK